MAIIMVKKQIIKNWEKNHEKLMKMCKKLKTGTSATFINFMLAFCLIF